MRRWWRAVGGGLALSAVVVGLAGCRQADRTFVVDSLVDAPDAQPGDGVCESTVGGCTVRAAFMEAAAQPDITEVVLGSAQRYELGGAASEDGGATGDLDVAGWVQLTGNRSVIAATTDRVVDVVGLGRLDAVGVTLEGAGAAGAWGAEGGGVVRASGTFVATDVTVTGGVAEAGGGVLGSAGSTLRLTQVTVAGNEASVRGGGLATDGTAASVSVVFSTVAGNAAPSGSALSGDAASLAVGASVLGERAEVLAPSTVCALGSTPVSTGGSVVADATCGLAGAADEVVRDPWLSALEEVEPGVWARLPRAGSPVLEHAGGAPGCAARDQRGEPRPIDGDGDGLAGCDAGAVEGVRALLLTDGSNQLGWDPELMAPAPTVWLNVAGRNAQKSNGDRHGGAGTNSCAYGCVGGENVELADDGTVVAVDVASATGQPLTIEAFDPAYTYTGDFCETGAGLNFPRIAQTMTSIDPVSGQPANPFDLAFGTVDGSVVRRYGVRDDIPDDPPHSVGRYCPGDQSLGAGVPDTTYLVRGPSTDPADPLGGPVLCHVTFSGRNPSDDVVTDWLGRETNPIDSDFWARARGYEEAAFGHHYKRWYELCEVPDPHVGRYTVQIRTDVDTSDVPAPDRVGDGDLAGQLGSVLQPAPVPTGGHNRLSLRAGTKGATPGTAAFADGIMLGTTGPRSSNMKRGDGSPTTSSEMPLVRLHPDVAGRTLELELWDFGDVSGGGVTSSPNMDVQVLAPIESTSLFDGCTVTRDDGPLPGSVLQSGCTIQNLTASTFNGHLLTVQVEVPADFTCDELDPQGCLMRLGLSIEGVPNDTTTWSARLR